MMTQAELLGFALELNSKTNIYWQIYLAVATAILGIFASGKVDTTQTTMRLLVSCIFTVFAASNFHAMESVGSARREVSSLLENAVLAEALDPPAFYQYAMFHAVLWALFLVALWFVRWPRS